MRCNKELEGRWAAPRVYTRRQGSRLGRSDSCSGTFGWPEPPSGCDFSKHGSTRRPESPPPPPAPSSLPPSPWLQSQDYPFHTDTLGSISRRPPPLPCMTASTVTARRSLSFYNKPTFSPISHFPPGLQHNRKQLIHKRCFVLICLTTRAGKGGDGGGGALRELCSCCSERAACR